MCTFGGRLLPQRVTFAHSKGCMLSICTDTLITAEMSSFCMHKSLHVCTPTLRTKICEWMQKLPAKGQYYHVSMNHSLLATPRYLPQIFCKRLKCREHRCTRNFMNPVMSGRTPKSSITSKEGVSVQCEAGSFQWVNCVLEKKCNGKHNMHTDHG